MLPMKERHSAGADGDGVIIDQSRGATEPYGKLRVNVRLAFATLSNCRKGASKLFTR
jgi:hypothetical protein